MSWRLDLPTGLCRSLSIPPGEWVSLQPLTEPPGTLPCHLRGCPFCHGWARRIGPFLLFMEAGDHLTQAMEPFSDCLSLSVAPNKQELKASLLQEAWEQQGVVIRFPHHTWVLVLMIRREYYFSLTRSCRVSPGSLDQEMELWLHSSEPSSLSEAPEGLCSAPHGCGSSLVFCKFVSWTLWFFGITTEFLPHGVKSGNIILDGSADSQAGKLASEKIRVRSGLSQGYVPHHSWNRKMGGWGAMPERPGEFSRLVKQYSRLPIAGGEQERKHPLGSPQFSHHIKLSGGFWKLPENVIFSMNFCEMKNSYLKWSWWAFSNNVSKDPWFQQSQVKLEFRLWVCVPFCNFKNISCRCKCYFQISLLCFVCWVTWHFYIHPLGLFPSTIKTVTRRQIVYPPLIG